MNVDNVRNIKNIKTFDGYTLLLKMLITFGHFLQVKVDMMIYFSVM